ncbi:MAG: type II toxin-antitoxin system VapC family toxin [Nevskia sp.]|nr:type II toxin-antitoxin system VapC family toxin [Nevskia sp.]
MRAVDTNILARYYLQDDPEQSRIATAIVQQGALFVPKTVALELAWVLRSVADQPAGKVTACLAHLAGLPGVTIENREQIEAAIRHCAMGLEFADALHLAACEQCSEFLTFDDRRYVRRAARRGLKPRVRVPTE